MSEWKDASVEVRISRSRDALKALWIIIERAWLPEAKIYQIASDCVSEINGLIDIVDSGVLSVKEGGK